MVAEYFFHYSFEYKLFFFFSFFCLYRVDLLQKAKMMIDRTYSTIIGTSNIHQRVTEKKQHIKTQPQTQT